MSQFEAGQITATPGAIGAVEDSEESLDEFLRRHLACDWGDVTAADKEANAEALVSGARLFSVYQLKSDQRLWIITEATNDVGARESTCVLLPNEY